MSRTSDSEVGYQTSYCTARRRQEISYCVFFKVYITRMFFFKVYIVWAMLSEIIYKYILWRHIGYRDVMYRIDTVWAITNPETGLHY